MKPASESASPVLIAVVLAISGINHMTTPTPEQRRKIEEFARQLLNEDTAVTAEAKRAAALEARQLDIEASLSVVSTLTAVERRFVSAFLCGMSQSDAYLHANPGYTGKNSHQLGWKLRHKANVQAAIDEYFHAQEMNTHEVLARVSEQARAAYADYLRSDGNGRVYCDVDAMIADGKEHLIKGFRDTKYGQLVEFYPADDAQDKIMRKWGLYQNKTDITSGGEKIDAITYIVENRPDAE